MGLISTIDFRSGGCGRGAGISSSSGFPFRCFGSFTSIRQPVGYRFAADHFFGVAPVNLPRYTIEEVQSGLLFYGVTSAEGSINAEKSVPRKGYNLVSFFVFPPGDTSILPPYFENTKKNADYRIFEPHLRVPYPFNTL